MLDSWAALDHLRIVDVVHAANGSAQIGWLPHAAATTKRMSGQPGGETMSTAQPDSNKAALSRLRDATNSGDAELISKTIDEVVEPNVLFHTPVPTGARGAQALKQVWAMLLRAFPDIHVTVDDVIAEGEKVVCRNTVTGTHQGEYMGLPPTDKSITYNEIFIVRFADGQFAEIWGVVDVASQMRQLGMLSA